VLGSPRGDSMINRREGRDQQLSYTPRGDSMLNRREGREQQIYTPRDDLRFNRQGQQLSESSRYGAPSSPPHQGPRFNQWRSPPPQGQLLRSPPPQGRPLRSPPPQGQYQQRHGPHQSIERLTIPQMKAMAGDLHVLIEQSIMQKRQLEQRIDMEQHEIERNEEFRRRRQHEERRGSRVMKADNTAAAMVKSETAAGAAEAMSADSADPAKLVIMLRDLSRKVQQLESEREPAKKDSDTLEAAPSDTLRAAGDALESASDALRAAPSDTLEAAGDALESGGAGDALGKKGYSSGEDVSTDDDSVSGAGSEKDDVVAAAMAVDAAKANAEAAAAKAKAAE